jgi:hypothetical protein
MLTYMGNIKICAQRELLGLKLVATQFIWDQISQYSFNSLPKKIAIEIFNKNNLGSNILLSFTCHSMYFF